MMNHVYDTISGNQPVKKNPEIVIVETPEHFQLELRLAGIGSRSMAFIIDRLIQYTLVMALITVFLIGIYLLGDLSALAKWVDAVGKFLGPWFIALVILVYGIIMIGYFIVFEYFWSGSTPGKKILRLRVMRKDGRPVTLVDSAVRNIVRFVDLFAEVYPIGLIVMFLDSKNRRLGDLAAGTYVVFDREPRNLGAAGAFNHAATADRAYRDAVMQMSQEDYRLATRFLARREAMDPEYRADLARELYERIFRQTLPAGRSSADLEQALESTVAHYQEKTRVL